MIDEVLYENYRDVKPGCFARLRILKTSDVFPSAVVAYKQGAVSDETLNRFRNGMTNANRNERGRDLMNLWKITSPETKRADFGDTGGEHREGVSAAGDGDASFADAVNVPEKAPHAGYEVRSPRIVRSGDSKTRTRRGVLDLSQFSPKSPLIRRHAEWM